MLSLVLIDMSEQQAQKQVAPTQVAPQVKNMDPEQLHKMSEVLGQDLVKARQALEQEREEKEKLAREREEMRREFEQMKQQMDMVKDEKRQQYTKMIESKVKPFLEELKTKGEAGDSRLSSSVSRFQDNLNKGLENAFMDPDSLATLHVAVAASSANQVTSSKLEELFQSQQQWETKFSDLKKEKTELEAAQTTASAELEARNKELAALAAELAALKEKFSTSVNNTASHFVPTDTLSSELEAPAPQMVTATASATTAGTTTTPSISTGFDSLFDFTPTSSWKRHLN